MISPQPWDMEQWHCPLRARNMCNMCNISWFLQPKIPVEHKASWFYSRQNTEFRSWAFGSREDLLLTIQLRVFLALWKWHLNWFVLQKLSLSDQEVKQLSFHAGLDLIWTWFTHEFKRVQNISKQALSVFECPSFCDAYPQTCLSFS